MRAPAREMEVRKRRKYAAYFACVVCCPPSERSAATLDRLESSQGDECDACDRCYCRRHSAHRCEPWAYLCDACVARGCSRLYRSHEGGPNELCGWLCNAHRGPPSIGQGAFSYACQACGFSRFYSAGQGCQCHVCRAWFCVAHSVTHTH
jgi:hypothetical protein